MRFSILHATKGDRPLAAMGLLMIAILTLAFQDSMVKLMSSQTSFWQFQTLRSSFNLLFTVGLALASGGLALIRPVNPGAVYLRSAFLTICMLCFFAAAPHLSISQMAAGLYTYPIYVSLLAAPVLGEKVGIWRLGAVLLGAIGAAIVLSPWREDFSALQLLPLAAGFFYACNILTLRRGCRDESPLALAFAVGLLFIICGIGGAVILSIWPASDSFRDAMPFIAIGWPELTVLIVGFAIFASVLNLTGNICLTRAYQTADASLLAPLDFSYLLFAALWGKLLFGAWPTSESMTGMLLIGIAGVVTAWRERLSMKRKS